MSKRKTSPYHSGRSLAGMRGGAARGGGGLGALTYGMGHCCLPGSGALAVRSLVT